MKPKWPSPNCCHNHSSLEHHCILHDTSSLEFGNLAKLRVHKLWPCSVYETTPPIQNKQGILFLLRFPDIPTPSQSYPQSGAGHHRQSGSDARQRRSRNSSYFSIRLGSSKMRATCRGASRSAHSGQLSCTRLSVISIRKYCLRQHRQDRWLHPWSSGSCSAG